MVEATPHPWPTDRRRLGLALALALGLRAVAALGVTWYAARAGEPCVFGDTAIYVALARTIVAGATYQVDQWGVPHYALRTPGYPAFLAACFALFGPSLLAVRLVQAALGAAAVAGVAGLTRAVGGVGPRPGRLAPAEVAVGLAAVEPYVVALAALVLSEGVFVPLMVAGLWGLATLWRVGAEAAPGRPAPVAGLTGLALGAAILARPSWALFVPLVLLAWTLGVDRGRRSGALRGAAVVALATALVLAPWWARNARAIGRFVPTALWVGASLYDGVSPEADGSSAMGFVDAPDVRALGEVEQDRVLRARALAFAREHPGRVLRLAVIKLGRYWSPWPNAETLRSPLAASLSAAVTLPVFALIAVGAWDRRRDGRALVLLLGPLLYFCGLHLVFVSSIRYRIPGLVPALGLAGFGWVRLEGWLRGRGRRDPGPGLATDHSPEADAR